MLVKLVHGVQIVNAECDLAEAADQRGLALVSRLCLQRPCGTSKVRDQQSTVRRIHPFGWQGGSATMVNMKSPNRFEVGANTGVVKVSRGVLHLEPAPRPVWDGEAVRHIIGGLVVAGHRCRGRPSEVVVQHLS